MLKIQVLTSQPGALFQWGLRHLENINVPDKQWWHISIGMHVPMCWHQQAVLHQFTLASFKPDTHSWNVSVLHLGFFSEAAQKERKPGYIASRCFPVYTAIFWPKYLLPLGPALSGFRRFCFAPPHQTLTGSSFKSGIFGNPFELFRTTLPSANCFIISVRQCLLHI